MRQIIAFFLSWRGVIGFFKQMACAIILSLCCAMAAADSSAISPSLADKPITPTHTVVIGDTLWNVAIRLRPDNMPMAQAMDILYESNPDAFLEGDSTKLIEGSVVSFPSLTVVEKIPEIIVSKQNSTLVIPSLESLQIEESEESEESEEDRSEEEEEEAPKKKRKRKSSGSASKKKKKKQKAAAAAAKKKKKGKNKKKKKTKKN